MCAISESDAVVFSQVALSQRLDPKIFENASIKYKSTLCEIFCYSKTIISCSMSIDQAFLNCNKSKILQGVQKSKVDSATFRKKNDRKC